MSNFDSYNNYIGYHNFMKFWAKNGEYNWIANTQESSFQLSDVKIVSKTYLDKTFWNEYDGTKNPLTGNPYEAAIRAVGW